MTQLNPVKVEKALTLLETLEFCCSLGTEFDVLSGVMIRKAITLSNELEYTELEKFLKAKSKRQ